LFMYWLAPTSRETAWSVVPAMAKGGAHLELVGRL
jgi:hypothetical protein